MQLFICSNNDMTANNANNDMTIDSSYMMTENSPMAASNNDMMAASNKDMKAASNNDMKTASNNDTMADNTNNNMAAQQPRKHLRSPYICVGKNLKRSSKKSRIFENKNVENT